VPAASITCSGEAVVSAFTSNLTDLGSGSAIESYRASSSSPVCYGELDNAPSSYHLDFETTGFE
jgi:hypothetical protein